MHPRVEGVPSHSPLRAAGVRAMWADVSADVRTWVEAELGSAVVAAHSQVGGFSPGVAARLTCADGTRAFVKAVSADVNPHTPELLRAEARVLTALPASRLRADLRAVLDADGWVVLLLDDVDGHLPDLPWTDRDLTRVLDALAALGAELTPSPWREAPTVAAETASLFTGWETVAGAPPPDLARWVGDHLDRLVELERAFVRALDSGRTLCHVDVRSDNILLTDDGVVFVDWNWAAVGPAWLDPVLLGWELIVTNGDLPPALLRAASVRSLEPEVVTACVVAGAGMLTAASRSPAPPGLPTIRAWQRRYADGLTAWLQGRTGWR